jgi:two-component system OmpR family response regulator
VPRILLAEADEEALHRMATQLVLDGFEVREARDGGQVLDWFLEGRSIGLLDPDVLVLDAQLPDICGLDLLIGLHSAGRSIPVIFMTASDDPTVRDRAFRWGAKAVLEKPVSPRDLRLALSGIARTVGPRAPRSARWVKR